MARFRTGINTRNACIAQAWVQSASKHHHTHAFIVKWFSNVINCTLQPEIFSPPSLIKLLQRLIERKSGKRALQIL